MRTLCAIRTYRWTEEEQRLADALRPVFGDDLAVAFHNRPDDVDPGIKVADFNDDWVARQGLRAWFDYGWRCGDYAYYALREAFPDYDYYWLIEPDVYFTGDPAGYFACFDTAPEDLLGLRIVDGRRGHPYAGTLNDVPLKRAIFAMTRLSGRALDALLPLRVENVAKPTHERGAANDEMFVFSTVAAQPDLTVGGLEHYAPSWFDGAYFDTDPDMLIDMVDAQSADQNHVYHPVRGRADFLNAICTRLATPRNGVMAMGPSIACLTDDEMNEIARAAQRNMLQSLYRARQRHFHRVARQERIARRAQQQDQ